VISPELGSDVGFDSGFEPDRFVEATDTSEFIILIY